MDVSLNYRILQVLIYKQVVFCPSILYLDQYVSPKTRI
jgi:hypothetical protein